MSHHPRHLRVRARPAAPLEVIHPVTASEFVDLVLDRPRSLLRWTITAIGLATGSLESLCLTGLATPWGPSASSQQTSGARPPLPFTCQHGAIPTEQTSGVRKRARTAFGCCALQPARPCDVRHAFVSGWGRSRDSPDRSIRPNQTKSTRIAATMTHLADHPFVVYWSNIPSPYVVERFDEIARRDRMRFEAWFNERSEPDRSWEVDESQWGFPFRYVPTLHLGSRAVGFPVSLFYRRAPDVLVTLYDQPSFVLGQLIARRRGVRVALWVEKTFDRWVARSPWKEVLKRWLFSHADAILTPGPDGHDFALRYRTTPKRIHTVPQVINVEHYRQGHMAARAGRDLRRRELGLRGVTFLYVGRLWSGKGIEYMLNAFAMLQRRAGQDFSLLLVGDGVDELKQRELSQRLELRNVVFAGFKQKPELPSWYALADVFVFPTLGDPYGLVVDEAMACSIPVITTTEAGEIAQRVVDGANGFVVPPESSSALADRMETLARDSRLRARMGSNGYERIRDQGPARWADAFERVIEQLMSTNSSSP
jgi:glycosyltransferase involved in cell wall biosynthesis